MTKRVWTQKNIDEVKKVIIDQLNNFDLTDDKQFKLQINLKSQFMRKKIHDLHQRNSAIDRLNCLLYILFLLDHLLKHKGYDSTEITSMVDYGLKILEIEKIDEKKSKFSYFYWELYFLSSRFHPDLLVALWNREFGRHLVNKLPASKSIKDDFYNAACNLNLGNASVALNIYKGLAVDLDKLTLDDQEFFREQLYINMMRSYRISGDISSAVEYFYSLKDQDMTSVVRLELNWEYECCKLQSNEDSDAVPLIKLVKRDGDYFQPRYLLESYLWSILRQLKRFRKTKLLKFRTLVENKSLNFDGYKDLLRICRNFENAHNSDLSFQNRFITLKKNFEIVKSIKPADQRLLIYAAMATWLKDNNFLNLAVVSIQEYISLSMRITMGRNKDVFNVVRDLISEEYDKYR
ncbi:MAG: hypothetical protein CMP10_21585 [Zetaproteobacteria bacterium]|nr:hypothetical protein [Pseudobdellovibrionaceae bacterium]